MKSIVKTLIAASLSIAAVSACSEEKLSPSTIGTKTTVHFGATSSIVDGTTKATLTTEDENKFIGSWENGDEIKINYYGLDNNLDEVKGDVNGTWNGSSFDASVESSVAQTRGSWEYKVAYPVPDASDNHVDFGSARTQKGNSYNSKYDIMIGKESGIINEAEFGKDDSGKNVVFNMERQTAIAYFHFTSSIDEVIESATLSVSGDEAYIASKYAYVSDFAWASTEDYKSITVTFPEEAPNAKDFQLWFNVLPTSYDSITLIVETATKTLTINNSTKGSYTAGHLYKAVKEIPADKWVSKETVYTTLAELNEAILAGETEFKLNLSKPAVITRICPDNKTTYLQDETGGVMYYSSTKIQNAAEGMTISGEVSGKATRYNGHPEITSIVTTDATFGTTADIPCLNLTVAELNANFNKYLNAKVKLTDVEVSDSFSDSDRNGKVKQGAEELAVYVKSTDTFEVSLGSTGDVVLFPALYNDNQQAYLWAVSDFETTVEGGKIVLNSTFVVNVGETVELGATTNSTATIKYSSADETIATVSAEGVVTGVKEGTVEITASIDAVDGFTAAEAKTVITVKPAGSAEAKTYTLTFPDENKTNNAVGSYTKSWEAKINGFSWVISNFNNNNWNNWTYIKAGSKSAASTASIATKTAIPEAISTVTMTIDAVTVAYVSSIKLNITDSDDAVTTVEGKIAKGDCVFSIADPKVNCKYEIVVVCTKAKSNGPIQVSKVVYSE